MSMSMTSLRRVSSTGLGQFCLPAFREQRIKLNSLLVKLRASILLFLRRFLGNRWRIHRETVVELDQDMDNPIDSVYRPCTARGLRSIESIGASRGTSTWCGLSFGRCTSGGTRRVLSATCPFNTGSLRSSAMSRLKPVATPSALKKQSTAES